MKNSNDGTLTWKAVLTLANNILQMSSRFIVGFIVTPIIITGLGQVLYGSWVMIQETCGYLNRADLRTMSTLKFTLARTQSSNDFSQKRRFIGAAFSIWALSFPIILLIGMLLVWQVPKIIKTSDDLLYTIRITLAISIFAVGISRLISLPGNVLRGNNLDFKAMGLNSFVILLGGGLSALAVVSGLNLPGLACAALISTLLAGSVRFVITKKKIPWFGIEKPFKKDFFSFIKISWWLFLSSLANTTLRSGELIIVGILLSPSATAIFATTSAILRITKEGIIKFILSGSPGIIGLCGNKDWEKLNKLKMEIYAIALFIVTPLGFLLIALNESFLSLWVSKKYYAGNTANILILFAAMEMIFIRIDSVFVYGLARYKEISILTVISSITSVLTSIIFGKLYGLPGVALGTVIGQCILVISLPILIHRDFNISLNGHINFMIRPLINFSIMLFLGYLIKPYLMVTTWWSLTIHASLISTFALGFFWYFGISQSMRKSFIKRFKIAINYSGLQKTRKE